MLREGSGTEFNLIADDTVMLIVVGDTVMLLIAENESDLQNLVNVFHSVCKRRKQSK